MQSRTHCQLAAASSQPRDRNTMETGEPVTSRGRNAGILPVAIALTVTVDSDTKIERREHMQAGVRVEGRIRDKGKVERAQTGIEEIERKTAEKETVEEEAAHVSFLWTALAVSEIDARSRMTPPKGNAVRAKERSY